MKNIRVFSAENFQFLEIKFSIYLNRRVFVMSFYHDNLDSVYWLESPNQGILID